MNEVLYSMYMWVFNGNSNKVSYFDWLEDVYLWESGTPREQTKTVPIPPLSLRDPNRE